MEKLGSEVDTGNVSGNVVDEFSVGVDMPGTSGERESLVIDRGDQPCTQQDTSTRSAIEKVVQSKRGQNLKEEEAERETDTTCKRRGDLSSPVGDIGMLGELNDSLTEM